MTQICVSNLTISGLDNGLWPGRRQAIIWTKAEILLTEPVETDFSEILIKIQTLSFKNMHESVVCKMASILPRPQCAKSENKSLILSHC